MTVHNDVSLNLLVIYSRDLESAKTFYSTLGLEFQSEKHGSGPEHYAASVGPAVFEIYPSPSDSVPTAGRFGFRVPSIDDVVKSLEQQNVNVLSRPSDSPWGRRAVVEDPDGNRVELMQSADRLTTVAETAAQ